MSWRRPPIKAKELSLEQQSGKLTPEEQMEIARLIAFFHTPQSVIDAMALRGKKISQPLYYHYKNSPKWIPIIQKLRDEYTAGILEVPISNKRKRLEMLETCYSDLEELVAVSVKDKVSVFQTKVKILQAANNEIEGKTDSHQNFYITQFNQLTDEEIDKKRLKILDTIQQLRKRNPEMKELIADASEE